MTNEKETVAPAFTTLKEYDAAVRRSQRKIKDLSANPEAGLALELAKASHKFLLACRAKFKETGLTAPDLSQAPKLRPEQEQAVREAFERGPDPIPVSELAQGVDPGSEPGKLFTPEAKDSLDALARMMGTNREPAVAPGVDLGTRTIFVGAGKSKDTLGYQRNLTAAEPQEPTPIDRAREFVPRARVIRERAHAGATRAPKYAVDDCRAYGLGYKNVHRKGEAWRRTASLAIVPQFMSERGFTQRAMPNHSKRRITVNGQVWA